MMMICQLKLKTSIFTLSWLVIIILLQVLLLSIKPIQSFIIPTTTTSAAAAAVVVRRKTTSTIIPTIVSTITRTKLFDEQRTIQQQPTTTTTTQLFVGDARGDYYGESSGSYMVKEFNTMEQLEEIVKLASQSLPERPDGIVTVVKFTSASNTDCRTTEGEYERIARTNPATLFLRCFTEYENSNILFGQASVTVLPTFDLFYGGNRVARVEGSNLAEVEELLERYQFQNSKLDLFSEISPTPWGDGRNIDYSRTPRTTARFIPGYDWNSNRGFFDATADKMESDFMGMYENSWIPQPDDDNNNNNNKKR